MMVAKLLHACVGVSHLGQAEAFYCQALGVTVRDRFSSEAGWTVSFLGNDLCEMEFELVAWEGQPDRKIVQSQDIHLGVCVDDLDAEHARMTTISGAVEPIVDHLIDGRPFARYFFAADPDGNWIEFLQRNERYR
jgi:lactoylglutathione lyase